MNCVNAGQNPWLANLFNTGIQSREEKSSGTQSHSYKCFPGGGLV